MARTPDQLSDDDLDFLTERHLGTMTTLRPDGSPHVVAVAFGYDPETGEASVISSDRTQKVKNLERDRRVVICQVDGPRWLALEGFGTVSRDPEAIKSAVAAFETRYRPARRNPERVAIAIQVKRVLGRT